MADLHPVEDEEQERIRLFQDVWGDAPGEKRPRPPRPPLREEHLPVSDGLAIAGVTSSRPDELELEMRQLREGLDEVRQMTQNGFEDIRATMLRLAEAVQAATRKTAPNQTR